MADFDDRNESVLHQLGDALSPDRALQNSSSASWADMVSRSLANDLADNHPTWTQRALFGNGSLAQRVAQHLSDTMFVGEDHQDEEHCEH